MSQKEDIARNQSIRDRVLERFVSLWIKARNLSDSASEAFFGPTGLDVATVPWRNGRKLDPETGEAVESAKQFDYLPGTGDAKVKSGSGRGVAQVGFGVCHNAYAACQAAIAGMARHLSCLETGKARDQKSFRAWATQLGIVPDGTESEVKNLTRFTMQEDIVDSLTETVNAALSEEGVAEWPTEGLTPSESNKRPSKHLYRCMCYTVENGKEKYAGISIRNGQGKEPPKRLTTPKLTPFPPCPDCHAPFSLYEKQSKAEINRENAELAQKYRTLIAKLEEREAKEAEEEEAAAENAAA